MNDHIYGETTYCVEYLHTFEAKLRHKTLPNVELTYTGILQLSTYLPNYHERSY